MLSILAILNFITAIFVIRFIIKNLLVNFKESEKGFKNMAVYFLVVVMLVFSLLGGVSALTTSYNLESLQYDLAQSDKIVYTDDNGKEVYGQKEILKEINQEEGKKNFILVVTTLEYVSLLAMLLLYRSIIKEINATGAAGKWKLDGYIAESKEQQHN